MPASAPAALTSRRPTVGLLLCAPAHGGAMLRLPALDLDLRLGRARRALLLVVAWLLLLLCADVCVGFSTRPGAAMRLLRGGEGGQGHCVSAVRVHTNSKTCQLGCTNIATTRQDYLCV